MSIPIKNIYYLLSYGWDTGLEYKQTKGLDTSSYESLICLLSDVFFNQCEYILKRNLAHNYVSLTEEYAGIKGKLDFNQTLHRQVLRKGRAVCEFDEWSSNVLINQILKTTLVDLLGFKEISKIQKSEIRRCLLRMADVDSIELNMSHCGQVNLNRNNQHYKLALHISELIAQNTVLDEVEGKKVFVDIGRDHQKLAKLFERFAFKFYKKHSGFRVKKERINWLADRFDYLPTMNTDVTLESDSRKIIIDTKFYSNTLGSRGVDFGANKFHSANLYQIFSYVSNESVYNNRSKFNKTEGVLLYPTTDIELSERFIIKDHPISVFTVNLNVEWSLIHQRMLEILLNWVESNGDAIK